MPLPLHLHPRRTAQYVIKGVIDLSALLQAWWRAQLVRTWHINPINPSGAHARTYPRRSLTPDSPFSMPHALADHATCASRCVLACALRLSPRERAVASKGCPGLDMRQRPPFWHLHARMDSFVSPCMPYSRCRLVARAAMCLSETEGHSLRPERAVSLRTCDVYRPISQSRPDTTHRSF